MSTADTDADWQISPPTSPRVRDSDDRLANPHSSIPNHNWAVGQVIEVDTLGATVLSEETDLLDLGTGISEVVGPACLATVKQ